MNRQLSEYLLSQIEKPAYIDKWCGTVQVIDKANVSQQQGTNRFPIGYPLDFTECGRQEGKPMEMVPDAAYKGILYFEDKGINQLSKQYSSVFGFTSNLRVVVWMNNKKISADQSQTYLSTFAVADLTDKLAGRMFTGNDIFQNVRAAVNGIVADKSIFNAYDYDDKKTAYLQGDYVYFAIDLNVTFLIPKRCAFTLQTTEPSIC